MHAESLPEREPESSRRPATVVIPFNDAKPGASLGKAVLPHRRAARQQCQLAKCSHSPNRAGVFNP
jgi:hypothetical protein